MNILAIDINIVKNLNRELGSWISWCSGEVIQISLRSTPVRSSAGGIIANSFNFSVFLLRLVLEYYVR